MTEQELSKAVCDLALNLGYMIARFPASNVRRDKSGEAFFRPLAYQTKGYPDLTLVRGRMVVVELKDEGGKLSIDQEIWRDRLRTAGVEYHLWRPADWSDGTVERVLR